MAKARSVVGESIGFRAMTFAPLNEAGVSILFGMIAADLGICIEEAQQGFPDLIGRRFNGRGWERVAIEFEYCSRSFLDHKHDPEQCDLVVCWTHNWMDCPIEVIELSKAVKRLPNADVARPAS